MKSLEQALMAKQGPLASCQVKEGRFVSGMLRFWNVLYRRSLFSGHFTWKLYANRKHEVQNENIKNYKSGIAIALIFMAIYCFSSSQSYTVKNIFCQARIQQRRLRPGAEFCHDEVCTKYAFHLHSLKMQFFFWGGGSESTYTRTKREKKINIQKNRQRDMM